MCYIWQKQDKIKDLSPDEIEKIFNNKLLKDLEIINITGGEPTLRSDLANIVNIILNNCLRLKRIDISTNGVNTLQVIDKIESILALLLPTDIRLTVNISLDGPEEVHEKVRGVSGIFKNIEETINELKGLVSLYPFLSIGLNMTVSKLNYHAIEDARRYAQNKSIGISFTLAAISDIGVESSQVRENFEFDEEEKDKIASSMEDLEAVRSIDPAYAKFILTWLKTGKRSAGCAFRSGKAILIEPDGQGYRCGNLREFGIGNLLHGLSGSILGPAFFMRKKLLGRCSVCNSNCYFDV